MLVSEEATTPAVEREPSGDREIVEESKGDPKKVDNTPDYNIDLPEGTRVDRKGNPIMKVEDKKLQKTKHKVTFIDQIEKKELSTTHYVLSYKKYNAMNTFDPYEMTENEG